MSNEELNIEDFVNANWLNVLNYVQTPHCSDYSIEYRAASEKAKALGDERSAYALNLIEQVTGIILTDDPDEPFEPMISWGNGRSAKPTDFTAHELGLIHSLVEGCTDPEMRARLNDILWVAEKDHAAGRAAIDEYLNSARSLRHSHWAKFDGCIIRAVQLAKKFGGRQNFLLQKCKDYIDGVLAESLESGDDQTAMGMIDILHEEKLSKPENIPRDLSAIVDRLIERRQYHEAHHSMGVLIQAYRKLHQDAEVVKVQLSESNLYEKEADLKAADGHFLVASDHMMKAINIRKTIGQSKESLEAAYQKLYDYQQKSADNMKPVSSEIMTITHEQVCAIKDIVSGKRFVEALVLMTRTLNPRGRAETEKAYEESTNGLVFQKIVSTQVITSRGAVVGQIPAFDPSADEDEAEERLMMHLYQHSSRARQMDGLWIDMMREEIDNEHHPSLNDFIDIFRNHPFIEPGHERVFARGLKAGMNGDLMGCLHFLAPQIESSLRHVLRNAGFNMSKINNNGTQDELHISEILTKHKAAVIDMLGEETYFNLRGLLITKYSTNFRHRALHGLMEDADFENFEILYLWWLVLRILLAHIRLIKAPIPTAATERAVEPEDTPESHPIESEDVSDEISHPEVAQEPKAETITQIGFSWKSGGPTDGKWYLVLENSGPEISFGRIEIPSGSPIELTTIPRAGLLVRQGGKINIEGRVLTDQEVTDAENPQGMHPFSFELFFNNGEKQYRQRCVTEQGLRHGFKTEESIAVVPDLPA
jgi:hypothetical protein